MSEDTILDTEVAKLFWSLRQQLCHHIGFSLKEPEQSTIRHFLALKFATKLPFSRWMEARDRKGRERTLKHGMDLEKMDPERELKRDLSLCL